MFIPFLLPDFFFSFRKSLSSWKEHFFITFLKFETNRKKSFKFPFLKIKLLYIENNWIFI